MVPVPSLIPPENMTQTLQLLDSYFDSLQQDAALSGHQPLPSLAQDIQRVDVPMSESCLDHLQASLECYEPDSPLELERRIVDEMVAIRGMMR